jgi:hypothetical protein
MLVLQNATHVVLVKSLKLAALNVQNVMLEELVQIVQFVSRGSFATVVWLQIVVNCVILACTKTQKVKQAGELL